MTATAKIGLFLLIALVILGAFIIKIDGLSFGKREGNLYHARFASAAGIDRKAPVRIAGVRIGRVGGIHLEDGMAVVDLLLDPEVRLYEGAVARVVNMGILGDRYIEISPGAPGQAVLPPGSLLAGNVPPSIDDVLKAAVDIGADVKEVTTALRNSVGGRQGEEKITEIVENIRELTASLKILIESNQANVNATTENFREFSATLRDQMPQITEKINHLADQLQQVVEENRENLHGSLENIHELSEKLQASADNLNSITGKIANGEGSIGKLINDPETVDNLNETLDSIDDGVKTLQDSLGRVRRFRLDMVLRGESLPEVSDARYAIGFDLWTTDTRFFRFEGVSTPWGKVRHQSFIETIILPDGTEETTTRHETRLEPNKILFNAQIGYRLFEHTTVRAGIFESEGGVALDQRFDLWRKTAQVTLEAYDWSRDIDSTPHLRLEGRLYINSNVFFSAGWDDPLYTGRSSFLFGGGVTWNDEDIKYSLGLASVAK